MLLVGTSGHLEDLEREYTIADEVSITAIAVTTAAAPTAYVLLDGERLGRVEEFEVRPLAELPAGGGQSLAADDGTVVVGTSGGHLLSYAVAEGRFSPLESFDSVEGREGWENPANPTPDLRSLAVTASGAWLANVHVGGLWRSSDKGRSWACVIEPEDDVHEVGAGAGGAAVVAAARGFAWSLDDGVTWEWTTEGLHAGYCRAVALDGRTAYVTASSGPYASDGRLYRGELGSGLEAVTAGLPDSFPFNLDTGCLAVRRGEVVFGTADGRVFRSEGAGARFEVVAERMRPVLVVRFA